MKKSKKIIKGDSGLIKKENFSSSIFSSSSNES